MNEASTSANAIYYLYIYIDRINRGMGTAGDYVIISQYSVQLATSVPLMVQLCQNEFKVPLRAP